ncbi:Bug family tripartite tricarboxylate transporter substrate binding protein [Verticiella sediminum]|nr:tripartite tricarboxylate transporter substrate binding protein [Verticiella sediminum]
MDHLPMRRRITIAALTTLLTLPASAWTAQAAGPTALIVPYAAGGAADPVVRPLAQRLQEVLGRPVIVENKPGANGIIGTQYLLRQPADGHTMMFHITSLIQNIALSRTEPPYDFATDIQPLALIGRQAVVLVVPSASPYQSLADVARAAKADPHAFSFGSYGAGSTSHIYGEQLRASWNIDMPHIAFKGTAPLLQDMLGGRVPMAFVSAATAIERQGEQGLRPIAVAHTHRLEQLPEVPTLAELGYTGFEATGWWGLFLRAGTPESAAGPLRTAIQSILREPDMRERMRLAGLEPSSETPQEISAAMAREFRHWEALSRRFDITLQ